MIFVAHDEVEAEFMAGFRRGEERVFGPTRWREYLDVYGSCSMVVANRVHGAVCAAGFGVPSVILGNDTRARIGEYLGIPVFRASADIAPVLSTLHDFLHNREAESERLRRVQENAIERYSSLLKTVLLSAHATERVWPETVKHDRTVGASKISSRVGHLTGVFVALQGHHAERGAYPVSSGGWDGHQTAWGRAGDMWVDGLVPHHLDSMPRDPRNHMVADEQYLYRSDGKDFKLISHKPPDLAAVVAVQPELQDPVRAGWAYGYWSLGAADW